MKTKNDLGLPLLLMAAFALTRWPGFFPPEWSNFSAAYALAFCAGVYLPRPMAWWLPLATLLGTDLLLNVFYYKASAVNVYMLASYPLYAALTWWGTRYSQRSSWLRLVCGGLLGACLFYLVTNTVAWLQNPLYPKTFAGWIQALSVGLPGYPPTWTFFRNTLLSGGLFTGLFAAAMKLTQPAEAEEEQEEEEAAGEPVEEPQETKV